MKNGGWGGFQTPSLTFCYNYILSLILIRTPHLTPHRGYWESLLIGIQDASGGWGLDWVGRCVLGRGALIDGLNE